VTRRGGPSPRTAAVAVAVAVAVAILALGGCIPVPNAAPVPVPLVPLLLAYPAVRNPETREERTYDVSALTGGDETAACAIARRVRDVVPPAVGHVTARGGDELFVSTSPRLHDRVAAWLEAERSSRR
jgi:hypothetical protein